MSCIGSMLAAVSLIERDKHNNFNITVLNCTELNELHRHMSIIMILSNGVIIGNNNGLPQEFSHNYDSHVIEKSKL